MADAWGVSWGGAWGESWRAAAALDITDTDILQKPIDCVLAGEVPFKDRYREFELRTPNRKANPRVTTGGARKLGGAAPSFRVRTDKRGYD